MSLTGINAIDQYETEEEIPESFHGAALIQCVETNELWLSNGVTTERVGSHLSGSTTISVTDNTNAALRITQLGTGNALVVGDSANPDSTPFMIDASGNVGIGVLPAFANNKLSIAGSGVDAQSWLVRYSDDAAGYDIRLLKTRSTNIYAQSVVQSGDLLGALSFGGDDGSVYRLAASISAAVDGTPGTNDMPGRLVFSTTADGASSPTERMRIDSSGNVGIGTTSPNASAILDAQSTTKGVRFPNMTTTQKNAIASPAAGLVIFDTTLAKLCLYTGAAWQTITSV